MLESLKKQLQNTRLPLDVRFGAILALVKFYSKDSFNLIREVFEDPKESIEMRSAAALGLGKLGEKSLFVLKKYSGHEDVILRNYVITAIGMTGEKALPILINSLKDEDDEIFFSVADAIGQIGKAATPYLTDILLNGGEDEKCLASWKLGELKDGRAIPALVETVKTAQANNDIMALSIWALGEISRKHKNHKAIVSALYRATRNQDPLLKQKAYIALNKARDHCN